MAAVEAWLAEAVAWATVECQIEPCALLPRADFHAPVEKARIEVAALQRQRREAVAQAVIGGVLEGVALAERKGLESVDERLVASRLAAHLKIQRLNHHLRPRLDHHGDALYWISRKRQL